MKSQSQNQSQSQIQSRTRAYRLKRLLLDVLYPNRCPFCGGYIPHDGYYCRDFPDCCGWLEREDLFSDSSALSLPANVDSLTALFPYNAATSPFVYSLKDGGDGYAIAAVAELLSRRLARADGIVCVPTDSRAMRRRGYNPPALIAGELSALTGIPALPRLLCKVRKTEPQKSLDSKQRRENVLGAFAVNPKCKAEISHKTLILVDDVTTTGATLAEAARVLREAGVAEVRAAVVASTISFGGFCPPSPLPAESLAGIFEKIPPGSP